MCSQRRWRDVDTLGPEQNGYCLADDIVKYISLKEACILIQKACIEVRSYGFSWQYVSIVSGNGLAPNRRQAIAWSQVEFNLRRQMAPLWQKS